MEGGNAPPTLALGPILAARRAFVQVGGAVVADSEEQAEYDETLAKAAALVRALWATGAGSESAGEKITDKEKVKFHG